MAKKNNSRISTGGAIIAIAILLIAVVVCGIITNGFKVWTVCGCFGHKYVDGICTRCKAEKPIDEEKQPDVSTVINNGESHNMEVAVRRLLNSEFNEYGISEQAESAYTLTATVTPANATYQEVDWNVAFKNPTSTWANGKVVTDYVEIAADGLTATVTCKQAFGEQIIITVTSLDNTSISASCMVDYRKRITNASVSFQSTSGSVLPLSSNKNTVTATIVGGTNYTVKVNVSETVGTLESGYKIKNSYGGYVSDFLSIIGLVDEHGDDLNINFDFNNSQDINRTLLSFDRDQIESWLNMSDYVYEWEIDQKYVSSAISKIASKGANKNLGRWLLTLVDINNNKIFEQEFYFGINVGTLKTAVTNVTVSNGSLIF